MAKNTTPKVRKFFVYLKTVRMFNADGVALHRFNLRSDVIATGGKVVETISPIEVFVAKTIKQANADMAEYISYLQAKADKANDADETQITSVIIEDKSR